MGQHSGGDKVGVRIANLVSKSIVHTHTQLLRTKHKLAMMIFHAISDTISEEVHATIGPVLKDFHAAYGADGSMSDALDFMANKKGQLQALVGTSLLQQGLLWPLSSIINNELAPGVYEGIASNPHSIPDAGSIAQAAAKGLIDNPSFWDGMAKNGYNNAWARMLTQLVETYPDSGTGLELLRRGKITRDTFVEWMHRNSVPTEQATLMADLAGALLPPADAALAVLRGNMTQAEGAKIASDNGLTAEQFQVLIDNTGEPLGLMELLEARRRGFIDDARLTRGIVQSRVRDEWVDVAKAIAFSPMSTADAVNAVIQNHLDAARAREIASQNGLEPGAFDILVQTAGQPLSRTEMEELFNRGLVTQAQVEQALNESRLKPKYTQLAFALHTKLLPIRNLAEAVEFGVMPLNEAVAEAMKNGYSQADATTLIKSASARKLQSYRKAVVTAAESLYVNNALSVEDGMQIAHNMGMSADEAQVIFQAAEYKRQEKLIATALTAIRSKYIARHLDKQSASNMLDSLGIVAGNRDELLAVWDIELSANVRVLTEAQAIRAMKKEVWTPQQTHDYLMLLGYSDEHATILAEDA